MDGKTIPNITVKSFQYDPRREHNLKPSISFFFRPNA